MLQANVWMSGLVIGTAHAVRPCGLRRGGACTRTAYACLGGTDPRRQAPRCNLSTLPAHSLVGVLVQVRATIIRQMTVGQQMSKMIKANRNNYLSAISTFAATRRSFK